MGAKVTVNSPNTVVHASSSGKSPVFPDVCKTPAPPAPPIPIPYPTSPNRRQRPTPRRPSPRTAEDHAEKVGVQHQLGRRAGSIGGVVSNCTKGKAQFIAYSFDVKAEGQKRTEELRHDEQNGSSSYNAVG
jgi:hypothetical protein